MDNATLAALLEEWADLLDAARESGYKSRAYRKAAKSIGQLEEPLEVWIAEHRNLQAIQGVGPAIEARVRQILAQGGWPELEEKRREMGTSALPPIPKGTDRAPRPRTGLAAQLKGDLHVHTDATDGRDSLEQMVEAAKARGYQYVAITDHSKETTVARGLSDDDMKRHLARIRRWTDQVQGITVLAGAEVDILRSGRLDYPDALLKDMDVVLCSIHFRHKLEGKAQTQRILKAMSNEHADILAHPTGRRSGVRPGMEIDLPRILDAAKDQGWAIEMNGSPERRDLDAKGGALAAAKGVLVALDSDAHATSEFDNVRNCAQEAEKAGLTAAQVLNCLSLDELRKALRS
jgi:DNA polymerase (family X)